MPAEPCHFCGILTFAWCAGCEHSVCECCDFLHGQDTDRYRHRVEAHQEPEDS